MTPENADHPPDHDTTSTATAVAELEQPAAALPVEGATTEPAAEAFVHAMAMQAHQAAAAVEEDAPKQPTQGRLPIPRPPFDFAAAFHRIRVQRGVVKDLAKDLERAAKAKKQAQEQHDEADGDLKQLLDELAKAEDEAAAEQIPLPHGAECAWEREHPGQICRVCAESRAQLRQQREPLDLTTDASAIAETVANDEAALTVAPLPADRFCAWCGGEFGVDLPPTAEDHDCDSQHNDDGENVLDPSFCGKCGAELNDNGACDNDHNEDDLPDGPLGIDMPDPDAEDLEDAQLEAADEIRKGES